MSDNSVNSPLGHISPFTEALDKGIRWGRPIGYVLLIGEIFVLLSWEKWELSHLKAANIPIHNDSDIMAQSEMFHVEQEELDAFGSFVALVTLIGLGLLLFHSLLVLVLYVGLRTATQVWIMTRLDYDNAWDYALLTFGILETVFFHIYLLFHITRLYSDYVRLREREDLADHTRPMFDSHVNMDDVQRATRNAILNVSPILGPNGANPGTVRKESLEFRFDFASGPKSSPSPNEKANEADLEAPKEIPESEKKTTHE